MTPEEVGMTERQMEEMLQWLGEERVLHLLGEERVLHLLGEERVRHWLEGRAKKGQNGKGRRKRRL